MAGGSQGIRARGSSPNAGGIASASGNLRGVEVEVVEEFKPVEHPSEPVGHDQPVKCPLPEPSILNVSNDPCHYTPIKCSLHDMFPAPCTQRGGDSDISRPLSGSSMILDQPVTRECSGCGNESQEDEIYAIILFTAKDRMSR